MITGEQNPKADGRTVRAAKTALARKQISAESYAVVLDDRLGIQGAKSLGRDAGPDTPPRPISRISKDDNLSPCLCGCGELVPRRFKQGHDARMHRLAREYVRGERELTDEQMEYAEQSGKLERARKQVAKEQEKAEKRQQKQNAGE